MGEVVWYFLPIENSIYHVAAEQPHLYLIPQVQVNLLVLVETLEYVGSG